MNTDAWPVRVFIFPLNHNNGFTPVWPALRFNFRLTDPSHIDSVDHFKGLMYAAVPDASVSRSEPVADRGRLSSKTMKATSALTVNAGEGIHLMLDGGNFRNVVMMLRRNEGVLLRVNVIF